MGVRPDQRDDPGMHLRALITYLDHAEGDYTTEQGIKAIMDGGEVLADHAIETTDLGYREAAAYFKTVARYCERQAREETDTKTKRPEGQPTDA